MNDLITNISIINRYVQKYLDKYLEPYNIGCGQFYILFKIYENEGLTMLELGDLLDYDKATVNKSINKLVEVDYVKIIQDQNDKRFKRIFLTNKAHEVMNELYEIRNKCYNQLIYGIENQDIDDIINAIALNSHVYLEDNKNNEVKIAGIQKLSLLDYPNELGATIFTSGCNFKCPFCQNKDLVFVPQNVTYYEIDELMAYLTKRKGVLKAVTITGGECTLQSGLLDLIQDIKNLGYKIKIDTNGYTPSKLKALLDSDLVDYVAMDIKNSPKKYAMTSGLNEDRFDIKNIDESIRIIQNQAKDYEFRTTIVREFHDEDDIKEIAQWLKGSKRFSLQYFNDSENVIMKGLHSLKNDDMLKYQSILKETIEEVLIKGEEDYVSSN